MGFFEFFYRAIRSLKTKFFNFPSDIITKINFLGNNVNFSKFYTKGIPFVLVSRGGVFNLGNNFKMNNNLVGNPIGRPQKCIFVVGKSGFLNIYNNVGVSATAIVCHNSITIEDNVKIGGGVCIYDTDFHSLNAKDRLNVIDDRLNKVDKAVLIKKNVFIGAHSLILKGVTIGENSIVGAGSVVSKSIPDNQIWAGNPAKFIRKINDYS